mmetsp:Transcript_60216/g.99423  ORF Transcript_60216/g.99423 Transcript_60216/m.99423 type:complete len:195 (+) Transcript_60216:47-631(+)|eukprot:CAMPEP_0202688038 /NCGR_PEP_ID=MMETSP1385-20130828/3576_1 /ASSEMBLY_ACC=CAM_ASM_000861 /TAXON_ID=933848 /ORGANISM="Elphidium margaritaceum" /LENGTH=194 /DNA_ID=CAMNT_0049342913 /DNA_START=41 /DNA_END=625 /DNA_ORIENTATION=-
MASETKKHKIVVLGGGGVGKSALTIRLVQDNFVEEYNPTIEESFQKIVSIDNQTCLLEILDTAGQEEFTPMQDLWIRSGEAFLLIFSITSSLSFKEVMHIKEKLMRAKESENPPIILCGNKCDLVNNRQVDASEGASAVKQWGPNAMYFETSAKEKINNEECFYSAVRLLRKQANNATQTAEAPRQKKGFCAIL